MLRTKYLEGWNDRDIGKALDRGENAVEAKRGKLRLVEKLHPNRPVQRHVRVYTPQEDEDILTRYNNGEAMKSIADSYGVSNEAIYAKVERLLDRQHTGTPTGRRCLWCGSWFVSKEPKSIRRQCNNCRQERSDASFLTVY